jgi:hypothetical protein
LKVLIRFVEPGGDYFLPWLERVVPLLMSLVLPELIAQVVSCLGDYLSPYLKDLITFAGGAQHIELLGTLATCPIRILLPAMTDALQSTPVAAVLALARHAAETESDDITVYHEEFMTFYQGLFAAPSKELKTNAGAISEAFTAFAT